MEQFSTVLFKISLCREGIQQEQEWVENPSTGNHSKLVVFLVLLQYFVFIFPLSLTSAVFYCCIFPLCFYWYYMYVLYVIIILIRGDYLLLRMWYLKQQKNSSKMQILICTMSNFCFIVLTHIFLTFTELISIVLHFWLLLVKILLRRGRWKVHVWQYLYMTYIVLLLIRMKFTLGYVLWEEG